MNELIEVDSALINELRQNHQHYEASQILRQRREWLRRERKKDSNLEKNRQARIDRHLGLCFKSIKICSRAIRIEQGYSLIFYYYTHKDGELIECNSIKENKGGKRGSQ